MNKRLKLKRLTLRQLGAANVSGGLRTRSFIVDGCPRANTLNDTICFPTLASCDGQTCKGTCYCA